MTDRMSSEQFYASQGVEDWRVLWGAGYAATCFLTGSFEAGVALVRAIGEVAAAAGRQPDIDLRPESVTVRVFTYQDGSHVIGGLTDPDVELARQVSAAARELSVAADPAAVQHVQVAIDALVPADVLPFWHAVLGYAKVGDEDLLDEHRIGPSFWFQRMDAPRPQRNRFHIDIYVPKDDVESRIAAALAAGGQIVRDNGPHWWTLADAEGNEADLAIWG
jgi:4a-hydroxytetrahydrobiopterin dehydratase